MLTTFSSEPGAAWIGLADGKVNAMSLAMLIEVRGRLEEAHDSGQPVVICGQPGIFSAGFDLKTLAAGPEETTRMLSAGVGLILDILRFPRPVLTACTGHAYPMGAFLMLSADVRFGVRGPWKIGLNEVAIGLAVPEFAIALARHRLTPAGVARLSTAAMFEPDEAWRHGYLDYVVAADELSPAIGAELERMDTLDWEKYALTKARLNAPVIAAISANMP